MLNEILMNGFIPVVPVVFWNMIFMNRIRHDVMRNDRGIPQWFLILEHLLRIPIFLYPLVLKIGFFTSIQLVGMGIYCLFLVLYFFSWIPFLIDGQTYWNTSYHGVIAPFLLPLFIFAGIAMMSGSWLYFIFALLFTAVHGAHGSLAWRNTFKR